MDLHVLVILCGCLVVFIYWLTYMRSTQTPFVRFFCASSAACIAETVTYPIDALITRLQLQRG